MQAAKPGLEAAFDALLLAAGGAIAYISWGYGFGSLARPGPGLYPFFVGLAIAGCAATLLALNAISPPVHPALDRSGARKLVLMVAAFCGWVLAMPLLGYVVVTALAAYGFAKVIGLEGWKKPLAVALGTALFIYLLFDLWLYIDLPRGIFAQD